MTMWWSLGIRLNLVNDLRQQLLQSSFRIDFHKFGLEGFDR